MSQENKKGFYVDAQAETARFMKKYFVEDLPETKKEELSHERFKECLGEIGSNIQPTASDRCDIVGDGYSTEKEIRDTEAVKRFVGTPDFRYIAEMK